MRLLRSQKVTRCVMTNEIISDNVIEITSLEAFYFIIIFKQHNAKRPCGAQVAGGCQIHP